MLMLTTNTIILFCKVLVLNFIPHDNFQLIRLLIRLIQSLINFGLFIFSLIAYDGVQRWFYEAFTPDKVTTYDGLVAAIAGAYQYYFIAIFVVALITVLTLLIVICSQRQHVSIRGMIESPASSQRSLATR